MGVLHLGLEAVRPPLLVNHADFVIDVLGAETTVFAQSESGVGVGAQQLLHLQGGRREIPDVAQVVVQRRVGSLYGGQRGQEWIGHGGFHGVIRGGAIAVREIPVLRRQGAEVLAHGQVCVAAVVGSLDAVVAAQFALDADRVALLPGGRVVARVIGEALAIQLAGAQRIAGGQDPARTAG